MESGVLLAAATIFSGMISGEGEKISETDMGRLEEMAIRIATRMELKISKYYKGEE